MQTNICDLIDSALMAEQRKKQNDDYRKKNHYVRDFLLLEDGELEGRCLRENFYEWHHFTPTNLATKSLYNFKSGYMLEEMVGDMIERFHDDVWSMEKGRVVMIQPEGLTHPIKGKIDFVFRHRDPNDPYTVIVEMKTSHGRGISNRKFGRKYTGPMKTHIMQSSFYYRYCDTTPELYMNRLTDEIALLEQQVEKEPWKLGRLENKKNEQSRPPRVDPDELIIYYLSREDFNRIQFSSRGPTDDTARGKAPSFFEILQMNDFRCFKALESYMEKKALPPKTFKDGYDKYPCSYCWYKDQCMGDDV